MNQKKKKIGQKITMLLLTSVSAALLLTGGVSMWSLYSMRNISTASSSRLGQTAAEDSERALESMAGEHLQNIAVEKASYIRDKFNTVVSYVHGIASAAEQIYAHPERYPDRLVALPQKDSKELSTQLLWSERLAEPTEEQWQELCRLGNLQELLLQYNANNDMVSSTYVATESGWLIQADYIAFGKYTNDADLPDFYEANTRQWYQRALLAKQGETVYSDVIADIHAGGDCIVCSQPIYRNGEIVAVAGVGSYLNTVNDAVLNTAIGESGYAFLVNEKGQVMVSGAKSGETAADAEVNADLRESGNTQLAAAVTDMVCGGSGLEKLSLDGREVYLAYAPLEGLGWSFVTVMDVEEVVAPAKESQLEILALTDAVESQLKTSIHRTQLIFLAIVLLTASFISLVSILFTKRLTDPIRRLTTEVARLGSGNLDYRIHIATGDEVEDLGNAFNGMATQLQNYINNLSNVTAEKERIRTELNLASQIQADMLPDSLHTLTNRSEFIIHASMTPAKEVGGDFYDFFLTDEDHLAFLVGDVSGKGVPAALFMVVAKTLLRSHIAKSDSLAQAVTEVNHLLCANNQNGMFVTAWIGLLTLSNGILTYVNAGHNPPLLKRGGNKYVYMRERSGLVLAGMEDTQYTQKKVMLHPGDTVFLYTDGVTEANNAAQELYGEDRLEKLMNTGRDKAPRELAESVRSDLVAYQGDADQFDDITILALGYHGDGSQTKTCVPDIAQIGEVNAWVSDYLKENCISQKTLARIRLVVDEIYSNICYYSCATELTVGCKVIMIEKETSKESPANWIASEKEPPEDGTLDREVVLYFEDDGIPYNPLERPDPDVSLLLEDRKAGGLGIYLVKKRMDKVTYEYKDDRNCLTAIKRENMN